MSQRHRFMLVRDLSWTTFNVLAFGLGGEEELKAAIETLEAMEAAARLYASKKEGWSSNVGLFFHVYGHASVNALHLHMVDLDATGPTYDALSYKNLPLRTALAVLRQEMPAGAKAPTQASAPAQHSPIAMTFSHVYRAGCQQKVDAVLSRMLAYYEEAGLCGTALLTFKYEHVDDGAGYSAVQVFADAAAYERWAKETLASPLLGELKSLGSMIGDVDSCLYGDAAEIARSPMLGKFYPKIRKELGMPDLTQFGEPGFGWK